MLELIALDVIKELEVMSCKERDLLYEYYKIFYNDNGLCLNKDELEIYRDLIREYDEQITGNKNLSQESRKIIYSKIKSHHYILLLLGEPETYEEEKEYYKYVDIQFESDKNLAEMQKLIDENNQEKAIAEKEFLKKANQKTNKKKEEIYFRRILALKNSRKCKPGDIEYRFANQIEADRRDTFISNVEYLRTI
ncbi:MAG: hypothetical protein ISP24_00405 [Rickettsiales bacterium]|nr:hypothetical protein [Rickettsiales bacterium]